MSNPNPSRQELAQLVVKVLEADKSSRGLHSYVIRNSLQLDKICYVKTREVTQALQQLEHDGHVIRSDSGIVGSPYRYSWKSSVVKE